MKKSNVVSMLYWAEMNRHQLTNEQKKHADQIYVFSMDVDMKGFNELNKSPYTQVAGTEDPLIVEAVEKYKAKAKKKV